MHSTYWQWRTITQRYTDKHRRYVIFRNGHDRIGYERSGACRQQIYIYPIFNTVGQRSEREFQPETHHPAFFLSSLLPSLSLLSLISLSLSRSLNSSSCQRAAMHAIGTNGRALTRQRDSTFYSMYRDRILFFSMGIFRPWGVHYRGERNGEIIRSFRMILRNLLNCGWFVITMRKKCKGKFLFFRHQDI